MLTESFHALPDHGFVVIRPFNTGATDSLLEGKGVGKGFTCKGKSSKMTFIDHADAGTEFNNFIEDTHIKFKGQYAGGE